MAITKNSTSAPIKLNVLIVGAGLGGLALAINLIQRGHHVLVLEAAPALGEVGAGIQVPPNSVKLIARMGVYDKVQKGLSSTSHFPQIFLTRSPLLANLTCVLVRRCSNLALCNLLQTLARRQRNRKHSASPTHARNLRVPLLAHSPRRFPSNPLRKSQRTRRHRHHRLTREIRG
jgi:choline dehydrogenase-like flavoprotein